MGVGMLRRYHTRAPKHVNEPGGVEAASKAQALTETPAGNASAEQWRTYAVEQRGADPAQVAGMKRDELREQYGPGPE